jgi:hypothetical protein
MGGQRRLPAALSRRMDPVLVVQEAGWVPALVRTVTEYFAPTRIRASDRLDGRESLYRLLYLRHKFHCLLAKNLETPIRSTIFNSTSQYLN